MQVYTYISDMTNISAVVCNCIMYDLSDRQCYIPDKQITLT